MPIAAFRGMKKLTFLLLGAAGAYAAYIYYDRRAMALERARFVPPADDIVAQRVREALSRIVADADAVHFTVHERTVTLRGQLDRVRRDRVLRATLAVPGVKAVLNRFESDASASAANSSGDLPDLRVN